MTIDEIISELEADAERYRKRGLSISANEMGAVLQIYAEALRLVEGESDGPKEGIYD